MYGCPPRGTVLRSAADMSADYLIGQIEAGVTRCSCSTRGRRAHADDLSQFILPHTRKIFERLSAYSVPTIHFGVGTSVILDQLRTRRRRDRRRTGGSRWMKLNGSTGPRDTRQLDPTDCSRPWPEFSPQPTTS